MDKGLFYYLFQTGVKLIEIDYILKYVDLLENECRICTLK